MASSLGTARILDDIQAIIWTADPVTFRFTYVSSAAESILGYSAEEWLASPDFWRDHIHPDDRFVIGVCHAQVAAERDHELVYRMTAADGRVVWLRDQVRVTQGALTGAMFDITAEREALEQLVQTEREYRRLLDLAPVAIAVHAERRLIYVNPRFVEVFGANSARDVIGRDVFTMVHPKFVEQVTDRFRGCDEGIPAPLVREQLLTVDGRTLDVEVTSLPIRCRGIDAVQTVVHDITALLAAQQKLEEAERFSGLGQLAASITHEFNNVLMGIQPFTEILLRTASDSQHAALAKRHITHAIARGKRITSEVLAFTKPKEAVPERIDALPWLETVAASLRVMLRDDITLVLDGEDVFLFADRFQLEQIITNLVVNARDAMPNGGMIELLVRREPDAPYASIIVRDEGGGIPPEVLPSIFEPLFTTKRNGTGLGLPIARRLIENQGGTIRVESGGEGTTFELRLPVA